jgi:hypothetical protein
MQLQAGGLFRPWNLILFAVSSGEYRELPLRMSVSHSGRSG